MDLEFNREYITAERGGGGGTELWRERGEHTRCCFPINVTCSFFEM